jgi:type IV secretion/conjugal transfer VirB4 family ATPase
MFNLHEYKKRADKLSDLLPWARLVAPGIVYNKDGSFQRTYRFRGPDLHSSTRQGLISVVANLNNVFRRLGTGWIIYAESVRVKSLNYPANSNFSYDITYLIDDERREYFNHDHYENNYYITFVYLPPSENISKLEELFIDRNIEKEKSTEDNHLKVFITETNRIFSLFKEIMTQAEPLNDEETLTYLHSTISTKRHTVKVPEVPMYLDSFLCDSPLITGLEPKLGLRNNQKYIRVISVLHFPGSSVPGMLDSLNKLNFEYRWVTRFMCLDKTDAMKELTRYQKAWYAKRKNLSSIIKDTVSQSDSGVSNSDALLKSADVEQAKVELEEDYAAFGYFTMSIIVMDSDPKVVEKKAQTIEKVINSLGFTAIDESLNCVEAWLGSIPGLFRANIRQPILSTINLTHIFPLSAIWAGPEKNNHLKGPTLMQTQTPDLTPFRFDLHVGDVGHTMIVGPTGMGKSVLLSMIAAQFDRYKDSQVYFFDKDGSCRALTAGVGGDFYDLADEKDDALSFQPLANIDDHNERAWATEWILNYFRNENIEITPEIKKTVSDALLSLSNSPKEQRTISGLSFLIQNIQLHHALQPLTLNGMYGRIFDSDHDTLSYGRWQVFEMGKLMNLGTIIAPTLDYLFHRLEKRFTGVPTLLILDECWVFLSNPIFAEKIREWLKTLRKFNVSVVFATQSLTDIKKSSVSNAIIESCLTKIYLPNPSALEQTSKPYYHDFGLNDREIEIIARATPKKQYYYKSPLGSRLFELAMSKLALAYCGASSPQDQQMVQSILAEHGKDKFNEEWLKYKNLPDFYEKYKVLKHRKEAI